MEPDGLLWCSQEPSPGTNPEPHECILHLHTYFLKMHFTHGGYYEEVYHLGYNAV
jgi:hypothetical protein